MILCYYNPKSIRMGNGTTYRTIQVQQFLKSKNILEDKSPAYTSPQKGVAKRFLQTLSNVVSAHFCIPQTSLGLRRMVRRSRKHCSPKKKAVNNQIPYTVLFKRMPLLETLRRFGYVAHETLPKVGDENFSPVYQPMVLIYQILQQDQFRTFQMSLSQIPKSTAIIMAFLNNFLFATLSNFDDQSQHQTLMSNMNTTNRFVLLQ